MRLGLVCVAFMGVTHTIGQAALSQMQRVAVVLRHNQLRASVGAKDMMKLTWNQALADRAQAHSSSCPGPEHSATSIRGNDGENMAQVAATGFVLTSTTDLTASVQSWYDEIGNAGSYSNGGVFDGYGPCSGVCGHYTQVVWQAANEIGCGVASCPLSGMPGYQLTCQYRSTLRGKYGGNMVGANLFTQGAACTACPSGFTNCSDDPSGLCGGSTPLDVTTGTPPILSHQTSPTVGLSSDARHGSTVLALAAALLLIERFSFKHAL